MSKSCKKELIDCIVWHKEGTDILHNEEGPAIEYLNGNKSWWQNGRRHRVDGPAVIYYNNKEYWLFGELISDINSDEEWKIYQSKNYKKEIREYLTPTEWSKARTEWYKGGTEILHREDGPAVEYSNGDKKWYLNGKLHREDGPAVEKADGKKVWYRNGMPYRENGPTIETDGGRFYYQVYSLDGKIGFHREDGPAIIKADGNKDYYYKAIEYKNISSDEEWKNLVFIMKVVE